MPIFRPPRAFALIELSQSVRNFRLRSGQAGFTIVELLVVVTIIVVLIALLLPGMERAKYQTRLTVCGTRLRGITTGVTQYAVGSQQRYPYRSDLFMPDTLRSYNGAMDIRPLLRQYFSLDLMTDPLCEKIDLSPEANHPADEMVMSNVSLRFGWAFPGYVGMNKLGNPWGWTDTIETPGSPREYRFNVIAHDYSRENRNLSTLTTHPDSLGKLGVYVDTISDGHKYILSRWQGTYLRGGLDLNFAYADGAVIRFDNMPVNNSQNDTVIDERMTRVPNYGNGSSLPDEWVNIPKR